MRKLLKTKQRPWARIRCTGFTLVELLIVISISSIMMLSLSAAVSSSLDSAAHISGTLSSWQAVSSALRTMERDLAPAVQFLDLSERSISARVPNASGGEDMISYTWSGPGSPLVRSINDTSYELLPQVQNVSFSYRYTQQRQVGIERQNIERAVVPGYFETYLQSHNSALVRVCPASWRAQSFRPLLDTDRIDFVRLRARRASLFSTPDTHVLLTEIASGRVVAGGVIPSSSLFWLTTSLVTVGMSYHDPHGPALQTDREYRWVMVSAGGSCSADLEVLQVSGGSGPDNDMMYEFSTNQGATFQNLGHTTDMFFHTRGTHLISFGNKHTRTTARMQRVGVSIAYGQGDREAVASTSIPLQNF